MARASGGDYFDANSPLKTIQQSIFSTPMKFIRAEVKLGDAVMEHVEVTALIFASRLL